MSSMAKGLNTITSVVFTNLWFKTANESKYSKCQRSHLYLFCVNDQLLQQVCFGFLDVNV